MVFLSNDPGVSMGPCYYLSGMDYGLSIIGCWPGSLVIGCWLLAVGCWPGSLVMNPAINFSEYNHFLQTFLLAYALLTARGP